MTRFLSFQELRLDGSVVVVGTFDGLHRAHRELIGWVRWLASRFQVPSVVLYFPFSPRFLPEPRRSQLFTPEEKREAFEIAGVDIASELPIEKTLKIPAEDFLRDLKTRLGARAVVMGYNHRFGHRREGDAAWLANRVESLDLSLLVVPPVRLEGEVVNSERIRTLLREGDLQKANAMLSAPYSVPGKVIRGKGLGRKLGYPTANLEVHPWKLLPRVGIYAGWARFQGMTRPAAISVGFRPTVDASPAPEPVVEAHILGFEGDLYGEQVTLDFVCYLRDEQKFSSLDELKEAIRKDVQEVYRVLPTYVRPEAEPWLRSSS